METDAQTAGLCLELWSTLGVTEEIFKVGFCLPAGPYVSDDDVKYIVESIKEAIIK